MKITNHIKVLILFTTLLVHYSCNVDPKNQILIATAANMSETMREITNSFTHKSGIKVKLITNSSGKLAAQIIEGAPYDVFVSADMNYPRYVYNSGHAIYPPKIYSQGQLILWSNYKNLLPSLHILTQDNIKHIAIPNPTTAPYGISALEVLKKHHIYRELDHKLVFGESVSQTNQFILSKSAELGFTALSVALSPQLKTKGSYLILDKEDYQPIHQGVVLIAHKNKANVGAQEFYNYLFSNEARLILRKFGYLIPD